MLGRSSVRRFTGWCGRLARTGHARGISTGLREFRRSFAQEFHLGRNALGEYRERPVIARHSWPSTRCHRPRQPRGKRRSEEDVDFNATYRFRSPNTMATCLLPRRRSSHVGSFFVRSIHNVHSMSIQRERGRERIIIVTRSATKRTISIIEQSLLFFSILKKEIWWIREVAFLSSFVGKTRSWFAINKEIWTKSKLTRESRFEGNSIVIDIRTNIRTFRS